MVEDAIKFSPPELNSYLSENINIIKNGMAFSERYPKLIFEPSQINILYSDLIKELISGQENSTITIRKFGTIACYIAEIINPNNKSKEAWNRVPQATEEGKVIKYYGFQKINDANKRIGNIVERYDYSSGKIKKVLIENAYQDAVNEIVNFWINAWLEGGNNYSAMVLAGKEISHDRVANTVLLFENYSYSQSGDSAYKCVKPDGTFFLRSTPCPKYSGIAYPITTGGFAYKRVEVKEIVISREEACGLARQKKVKYEEMFSRSKERRDEMFKGASREFRQKSRKTSKENHDRAIENRDNQIREFCR